jgi:nucleoside-diphosphate-sugar epimerase
MRKIVILGCGWLGQQLGMAFAAKGHRVIGTRQSQAGCLSLPQGIEGLQLSLPSPELPVTLLEDAVVIVALPASMPNYLDAIAQITEVGVCAHTVIFCSSTGIYAGLSGVVSEDLVATQHLTPKENEVKLNDLDIARAVVKTDVERSQLNRIQRLMAAELLIRQLENTVVIRLAGLIGPSRHPARFCQHGPIRGADLPVNLVHSADIARYLLMLLAQKSVAEIHGSVVNLCGPEHPSKQQFYPQACLHAQMPAPQFETTSLPAELPKIIDVERSLAFAGFSYQFANPIAALPACLPY